MENQEAVTSHESKPLDADKLKGKAIDAAEQIKARGKQTAAESVEQLANALDQATESLERGDQRSLAGYTQELAGSIRSLAANLRDRSLDDLVRETQVLARRNPTMFFFGSVAVGIALSRFLKASGEHQESHFPDDSMASDVAGRQSDWQRTPESAGSLQANRPDNPAAQAVSPACTNDIAQKGV
jgi:hypothetical protein